jgi:hypothetical protein
MGIRCFYMNALLNVNCHNCVKMDALTNVAKNYRILARIPGKIPDVEAPITV